MNVKTFYECQFCRKEYESEYEAHHCHAPQQIYRCGKCEAYHGFDEDDAESCCQKDNAIDIKTGETR